jgi:EAL domain-containing protein (putative c-di-GMP-specific phosphodiesterase class I)
VATIQETLRAGKLYIVYQPIIDLGSKSTFGYEALVRSGVEEFPNAGSIIEAAVEARFMGELGRALRHMAVEGCPGYPIFVNVHPDEFDEGWLVRPDDAMNGHDHDIYLEITESVPHSHYRYCHAVLGEVRRRGVRVAVDDLGAGYSNLRYIADLEPEVVKLDRGLVAGVKRSSRRHRLVTSIVELCRSQGARVVVEGIETADELSAVLETGAQFAQGYYFARPAPELVELNWRELIEQVPPTAQASRRSGDP